MTSRRSQTHPLVRAAWTAVPPLIVLLVLFAWLARQRCHALPGNATAVTGARRPAVLGGLFLPQ